ncbi:hypothetical protein GALL_453240 [mine drainage metagenome]|uniref:Uncharacterized protein n=1 Tax=mine drainage metagenome TaxID=410659 RepID=A0A1J5PPG1_9ZZZZ
MQTKVIKSYEDYYFDEELTAAMTKDWREKISFYYSPYVPVGWHDIVVAMFNDIAKLRGHKKVMMVKQSWGMLTTECYVMRRSGRQVRLYEIEERYRSHSIRRCFGCGHAGVRKIVGSTVQVLCGKCLEKLNVVMRGDQPTGTWLDQV